MPVNPVRSRQPLVFQALRWQLHLCLTAKPLPLSTAAEKLPQDNHHNDLDHDDDDDDDDHHGHDHHGHDHDHNVSARVLRRGALLSCAAPLVALPR